MGWRSAEVIRSPEATVTAQPSGAPIAAQPVRRRRHDRQAVVDAGSVGEPIQRVWQAYAEVVGDRVVLTAARVELIRSRLSGWSADELVECVKGYGTSRFHFGENDRGRRYVDLELWLRDAQHVESGLRMWRDQKRSGAKARSATDAAPKSDMEAKWDEFFKHNPEGVYVFPRVTKGESDAQQH